jgi:hypothetical protein
MKKDKRQMPLTRLEKERILDSRLKLQSVTHSLNHLDSNKVPQLDEIQECLEGAEDSLKGALEKDSTTT